MDDNLRKIVRDVLARAEQTVRSWPIWRRSYEAREQLAKLATKQATNAASLKDRK